MLLDQEPNIGSGDLVGKPVGAEQERRLLRKSEGVDLYKVNIVGRVRRTSEISVHLIPARVAHGSVFVEFLRIFQFTHGANGRV